MGDLLAKFDIMTPSDGERQAPKVKSRDITNKKTRENPRYHQIESFTGSLIIKARF